MIHNPIIRGFNPDPSITYDGKQYVLAVSTFEYMPGITLYTSKDLRKWDFAASVLDGKNGFSLENAKNSMGIYAPTIRYHKGTYYIVTTEKNGRGNFITYSENIHGPWSKPSYLTETGIDPSIFFDDEWTLQVLEAYQTGGSCPGSNRWYYQKMLTKKEDGDV